MAVTLFDLNNRIRRALGDYQPIDTLGFALVTGTTTSVTPTTIGNYSVGDRLVIDQELMFVTAVGTSTLTVVRGFDSITGAGVGVGQKHSANAPVLVNPRFNPADILDAINEAVRMLYPYWFKWVEDESLATTSDLQADYALPAAFGESGFVTSMEILMPGLSNDGWRRFRWFHHFRGTSASTISLIRIPPVSTKLRLIGVAPFTGDFAWDADPTTTLATLTTGMIDSAVPAIIMYCLHYLHLQAEAQRDQQASAKNIGGAAVVGGLSQQVSAYHLQRFQNYCATHAQRWPTWQTRRRV